MLIKLTTFRAIVYIANFDAATAAVHVAAMRLCCVRVISDHDG